MTTFERIKQKCLLAASSIDDYEQSYSFRSLLDESLVDEKREIAAREIAELAQMISNAAKVTETITETE